MSGLVRGVFFLIMVGISPVIFSKVDEVAASVPDVVSLPLSAKEIAGELTLTDAVHLILSHHPSLQGALGVESSSRDKIDVEKSRYYPQVSGGVSSSYDRHREGRFNKKHLQNFELNVEQMLYDFGKTSSAVKKAEFGSLNAKSRVDLVLEQLIKETSQVLLETARSKEQIRLALDFAKEVEELTVLVERRYEKGASTLSDVLQAKSRNDMAQTLVIDLKSRYQQGLQQLMLLTNLSQVTDVSLADYPTLLNDSCSLQNLDWSQIPEVVMADMAAEEAAADLDLAAATQWPTLTLQAGVTRALNATPAYGNSFDNRFQLSFSMPFYQGGGLSANKRAAAGALQAARSETQEVKLQVQRQLSELFNQYQSIRLRETLLSERVQNISGTKGLYKKQYLDLGSRTLVDLLNSEQEYHQARVDVLNSEFDKKALQIECAYTKGLLANSFGLAGIN